MNELDRILMDQLYHTKKRKKMINMYRHMFPGNQEIYKFVIANEKMIEFYETQVEDKKLLQKKHKKKKEKNPDILARNPVYEWYRNAFYLTTFGYKMIMDSTKNYMSYIRKDKE